MQSSRPEELVDLDRYPVDRPGSREYRALVGRLREELGSKGCAVLKGFVRGERLAQLVAEADRVAPEAHRSFNRTNPYFTQDDRSKPESHPIRRFYERSNAFVPADNFGPDSPLRGLYEWNAFAPFFQDALDEEAFYRYADPLADVIINVVEPGSGFPWLSRTRTVIVLSLSSPSSPSSGGVIGGSGSISMSPISVPMPTAVTAELAPE